MKQFYQTILFILFLFQGQAKASQVMGGDISYRYLGGLKYELTFRFYRDCRGVSVDTMKAEMIGTGCSAKIKRLSLTRVSIKDVSNYCKKTSNPCGSANTGGASLGIEVHTFMDTVDFNKADSAFKKCCIIQFGFGQCCRSSGMVYGSGKDFWVWSTLDICNAKNNSSPILTSIPNNIICCNQPHYYSFGALDTLDHDSLSYSYIEPRENWGKSIPYPTPPKEWITTYWPTGYDKNKGPKPDSDPPIGSYFDPEYGDLIFTPINCSESTFACFKISEWRKDSSGQYRQIGEVRRDIMYVVQSCSTNNPPLLSGPYKYEICAGNKLCFMVVSTDKQSGSQPDTVTLSWNNGINKGATFKIVDATARLQKGQFCWTPKESDASDLPYTFTVTARDNNCPQNGISVKMFSVKVKKVAKATWTKTFINNGLYQIKATPEKGFKGTATYRWQISDSNMKWVDTAHYFHSTDGLLSNRQLDSVQFYKGGKYILSLTVNNPPLNCPTSYFDTVKVAPVIPILRISPTTLQEKWVCKNAVDTIFPILRNARKPVRFRWSSSSADTLPYLIINTKQEANYRVDVYDSAGYHRFAEWKIYILEVPVLKDKKDVSFCKGDTISLSGTPISYADTVYWKWFLDGNAFSTNNIVRVSKTGLYTLQISDSTKCIAIDTIKVDNMIIKIGSGIEKTACLSDTVTLSDTASKMVGPKYWKWYFEGKQMSTDSNIRIVNPGKYSVEISDSNNCLTWRDTIERKNMIITADAGPDIKVCQYEPIIFKANGLDTLNGNSGAYLWYREDFNSAVFSTKNTFQYNFNKDGRVILELQQKKGTLSCSDLDTVYYSFRPLPEVILKNNSICQNETELDLQNVILKPVNSNKGILTWQLIKTLKKPGGNANTLTDLIYDKDPTSNTSYFLKVAESTIDLNGKFKDSIVLSLMYKDEFGCQNVSSNNSNIVVRSNVAVTFIYDELKRCHGDSVTYISNDYGVNYYGGLWFSLNDSSNYLKWPQGHLVQLYEKLGTTSLDPKGGKYKMRYLLENNQCFSSKDAVLTIVPYPEIAWTQTTKGDSIILTDKSTNAQRREWFVNAKKISTANTLVVSKQDAVSKTILLKVFNITCQTDSIIKPQIVGINKGNISLKFSISPNPVKNDLFIKALTNEPYSLEIINNIGQSVLVKIMGNKNETIDVSEFPNGIYNLILKTSNAIFVQKFIKTYN